MFNPDVRQNKAPRHSRRHKPPGERTLIDRLPQCTHAHDTSWRVASRSPICGAQGGGRRAAERCVGSGAEGLGGGCGRPTERDARDHTLGRRRRKRPLADLAAHASGVPVHSCCRARVIGTAERSRAPSEQVVRRPAAAVERPRCSTSHDDGTGHLEGPLDGYERRADERPHSRRSEGSRRSACDARGTDFLAISMVTTGTLGERSSASW